MPWKETNMINERTEFALRSLQEDLNFSELCEEYGISRPTGYKWKKRFLLEGASAMPDQSSKPLNSPSELGERVIVRINRLHEKHPGWGPKKVHDLYLRGYGNPPSLSSIKRIFERSGWVTKRRRRRSDQSGRISSGRKATSPNEVWTVDFKGWWNTGDGQRCEPLTVRDEYSRYLFEVRAVQPANTETLRACFERLFHLYGLPQAIRSDNGVPFASSTPVLGLTRLSAWWLALGIDLERGRPGKPQDNGGHERMHRDIRRELQACAAEDIQTQQASFDVWKKTFNEERPHEALAMATPAEVYSKSPRAYEGTPADIEYPGMITRKVHRAGHIAIENIRIAVSRSLAGWSIGLKPIDQDRFELFFAKLRLGTIELSSASFAGVASHPGEEATTHLRKSS